MRKIPILFVLLFLAVVALFAFTKTNHEVTTRKFKLPDNPLQNGDIIFRDGRGAISTIFRELNLKDQSYSHCGIIHVENGKYFVLHVIGGENSSAGIRKEALETFCNINAAYSYAVYRSDLDGRNVDSVAMHYLRKHIIFDDQFDLTTNDKMYCTEYVYKVLNHVAQIDNFLPLTTYRNITYCSCDNIFLSSHLSKIYSFKY